MNRTRPIAALSLCIAMCAVGTVAQTPAGRWDGAATDLAKQIVVISGPGPATLVVENASSIAADQVLSIRRLLEADLRGGGVNVRAAVEGTAIPTALRVTLSQNAREGLWVAQVQQGEDNRVAIVAVPLSSAASISSQATMTLRKQFLFEISERVLDAQTTADGALLTLTPARIAVYRQNAGSWQQAQTFAISPAFIAAARDPRGELIVSDDSVSAYLPGSECNAAAGLSFTCHASDDPWPIGTQKAFYNASRDYFSGVLVPATTAALPPFYSAAELPRTGAMVTIFADIHGHTRMLDRGALVDVIGSHDWGSDLAAVRSGCGAGVQVLVDTAGDPVQDSIRAYEISGHEAQPASAPLDLDGTLTSLRETGDHTTAIAVVHNNNRFEVWRVALDCR